MRDKAEILLFCPLSMQYHSIVRSSLPAGTCPACFWHRERLNEEAPRTNLDIIIDVHIISIEVSGGCVFIQPLFNPLYCVKSFLNHPDYYT